MRVKSDLIITDLTEQAFTGQRSVVVHTTTVLEKGRPVMKIIQHDGASIDIVTCDDGVLKVEAFRGASLLDEPCRSYMERLAAYVDGATTTISWETGYERESTIGQPDLWTVYGSNHDWTILIGAQPILTLNHLHEVQGVWGEPAVVEKLRQMGLVQPPMVAQEL